MSEEEKKRTIKVFGSGSKVFSAGSATVRLDDDDDDDDGRRGWW